MSFLPRDSEGRVDWALVVAYVFQALLAVAFAFASAKGWLS